MPQPDSAASRDIAYHLHGYTNARAHLSTGPLVIDRGEGVEVFDDTGKAYIEAMAGLWSVAVGFSEPRLVEAARRQMSRLPFYHGFSHRSHAPMIDLAEKLATIAPIRGTTTGKVFFTNSGSEANDTAIKFIWYRANALGTPRRKKIICRDRAYHGVTVASASLTGLINNHRSFDLPIMDVIRVGCPHYWREGRPGESEEAFATRLADELEARILAEGPDTIAAFFAEPLQGAGGVVIPPPGYWAKIQAVLRRYDILLVADEVITGFGRTGRMFGCETYGIEPDMMVLSKALSSSYQPISALLVSDEIFAAIADESDRIGTLGHGYTGGGHPVAAAVALENIAIIEEEKLVDRAAARGDRLLSGLRALSGHPLVGEVRGVGLIAAVELVTDKATRAPWETPGKLGATVIRLLQEGGVIARAMGDAIAFCPPLIISDAQVDLLLGRFHTALDRAATLVVQDAPHATQPR